jgi:diguanylate cyclase
VAETSDWRQKYRESLLEMEAEEKRWRLIEQQLRRLIGRLCAAGMGVDPALDDELKTLAAANRRNADASELERMADSLTNVVVAVDDRSPVLAQPASRWNATCGALADVLQSLKLDAPNGPAIDLLVAELSTAATDIAVASVVNRTTILIRERADAITSERLLAANVLSEVTQRLEEMSAYLAKSNSVNRGHFEDTQSFNETLMLQVRELNDEVSGATELRVLQSVVNNRLASVSKELGDFYTREQHRQLEQIGRAELMQNRIADLEREAQDLHSKLDREKHGARLDPLTGAANRRSFDERFASEFAARKHSEAPIALLLGFG